MKRGHVVSDLHLFSRRSEGEEYLPIIKQALATSDVFVLNGDLADFWWTSLNPLEEVVSKTLGWIEKLVEEFPKTHFYLTIGNHDDIPSFIEGLKALSAKHGNITVEPLVLKLGTNIFVHGDMCNREMTKEELINHRSRLREYSTKSWPWHLLYEVIVQTRVHRIAYLVHPRALMAKRILYFLKSCEPETLKGVTDIFFGHTHAPFTGFEYEGFRFHNTGSGIRKLKFLMLPFS